MPPCQRPVVIVPRPVIPVYEPESLAGSIVPEVKLAALEEPFAVLKAALAASKASPDTRSLTTILLLDTLVVIPIFVPAIIVSVDVLVAAVSVFPLATITV